MEITTMPTMELVAVSLIFLGLFIFVVGGFWFLVAAFRESVLWVACLFIPIVSCQYESSK